MENGVYQSTLQSTQSVSEIAQPGVQEGRRKSAAPLNFTLCKYDLDRLFNWDSVPIFSLRLGVDEKEVRRMLDAGHGTKLPRIAEVVEALGRHLHIALA